MECRAKKKLSTSARSSPKPINSRLNFPHSEKLALTLSAATRLRRRLFFPAPDLRSAEYLQFPLAHCDRLNE